MPQSLSRILVHLVFSTKARQRFVTESLQPELHAYMAGTLSQIDCPSLQVGGTDDHVHLLFGLSRTRTIAEIVEKVKTSSSKWMKSKGASFRDFQWQAGYGAFSVGPPQVDATIAYIRNQAHHHRKTTFQDEFRRLMASYSVGYDERYVWD